MKMYEIVFLMTLLFFMRNSLYAGVDDSRPLLLQSSIKIVTTTSPSVPKIGVGKMVYYPQANLLKDPKTIKLSFEISRLDSNGVSYDFSRLNFIEFGIECYIMLNEDPDQYWNNAGLLKDFAADGSLYTDESFSPPVNLGMLMCPYDKDGNIITSLVGTRVADIKPYSMNGSYKVHSDPSMKVHKIKIIDMPFTVSDDVKGIIQQARQSNPTAQLSLQVNAFVYMNYALNVQNGCLYILGFRATNNLCWVHFDGRLKPSNRDFSTKMFKPGTIQVPAGCLSWLDLYESSSPSEIGTKVDLNTCDLKVDPSGSTTTPPPPDSLIISGLPTNHERRFYTLRTRIK